MKTLSEYREELIQLLSNYSDRNFIVEGKKDVEVLKKFNIESVIYLRGRGLHQFCEELEDKDYIILTDFDPEGEQLAKKLEEYTRLEGVTIDRNVRNILRKAFIDVNLNTIQGLRNLK